MQAPLAALRRFVPPRSSEERCYACGAEVPAQHTHQLDPKTRLIHCACDSCAMLYRDVYRDIPTTLRCLSDFEISDAQWEELAIPIALAFFSFHSTAGRVVALYPGPAGATESLLRLHAWDEIVAANPVLAQIQPDVEALLVNRVGDHRDYLLVPIDECYKLVGIIRLHWRGLSGGALVWGEIERFFETLRERGRTCRS